MTTTLQPVDTSIHTRALLVSLNVSTWTARRYDKTATQKVSADFNASSDAGRYNKFLLPGDAASYKALTQLASAIRVDHYKNTLAWSDDGWRILPTANYLNYTAWFRQQQTKYENAIDAFAADYPSLRSEARMRLNGLYRDEDYPSVVEIRSKFAIAINYLPLPTQGDIRVNLASDQVSAIEQSIADRVSDATRIAMADAWDRLYSCVAHISERLSNPEAIFRNSLIENAREVCDTLKRLNVTDDPDLERMRAAVEVSLTKIAPDILRDDPAVRLDTAQKADDIMAAMAGFYTA